MFADLVKPLSSIRLADIARLVARIVLSEGVGQDSHDYKYHATSRTGKRSSVVYCSGVLAYYDSRSISPALPSSCSCQRPIIWSSKLEARKASLDLINDPLYEGPKHNLGESAVLKRLHKPWGLSTLLHTKNSEGVQHAA